MIGLFFGFIFLVVLISLLFHISVGWAFAVAIVLGAVIVVGRYGTRATGVGFVFSELCPQCRKRVKHGANRCPYCGSTLLRQ